MRHPPRRDLLKLMALGASLGAPLAGSLFSAGRAFATPQSGTRVLVVFLRGAYDAANVVAPTASDFYHQARPGIGLARPDPANPLAALPLDADWSLHPALKDTVHPFWAKKQLAFVPYAGTDDLSRSHFETQATVELGQPLGGPRDSNSGFMGRLARVLNDRRPIAFTDQLPLTFRGGPQVANIGLNGMTRRGPSEREADLIQQMYKGQELSGSVARAFEVQDQVSTTMAEMQAADHGAVSAHGFELSARRIGRLMQDQFNLAFVDVGGWDTHVNQGGATGYLANRLGELGRGLAGFADEIGPADWNNTVVVAISEFGRTFRQNGDAGTDHGHGTTFWVMGGGIAGGRLAGEQIKLTPESLNEQRDYPVLTDYRAFLGGLFQRIYGLNAAQLDQVFPQVQPKDLQLV